MRYLNIFTLDMALSYMAGIIKNNAAAGEHGGHSLMLVILFCFEMGLGEMESNLVGNAC